MSATTASLKAFPVRPASSAGTTLRRYDATAPTNKAPLLRSIARDDPETVAIWRGLFDEFVDSRAAKRFQFYSVSHAVYRWKPKLALILPDYFSVGRASHRRDLAVALEVLASVIDHYNIDFVSDSPDAASLFQPVVPFSHAAVSACKGAVVILSRSLNDAVAAIRPSRYVAADPCAFLINQKRVVFSAGGAALPSAPATDGEIARDARGSVPVLLDEDEEAPSFVETLRRLRAAGLSLRISLSSRADEEFAQWAHAAFKDDPRVQVRDPEPLRSIDQAEFRISNDPVAVLAQRPSALPRFLFRRGAIWRVDEANLCRSDFYMLRGEESNSLRLLRTWLGRCGRTGSRSAAIRTAAAVEPLVSIVVPIYDGTSDLIRLAHSIYEQDYPWIEVVFVCNGSPPETIEAIRVAENYLMKRRFGVRIIELVEANVPAAIPCDFGVRASSGDLICMVGSGDSLGPGFFDFLKRQTWCDDTVYCPRHSVRESRPTASEARPFDRPRSGLGEPEPAGSVSAMTCVGNVVRVSGVCVARTLFDRAGGIDHRMSESEAFQLWWRSATAGARTEEHNGRVDVSFRPGSHGPLAPASRRSGAPCEPATGPELGRWL
jgi:hypothetical protein